MSDLSDVIVRITSLLIRFGGPIAALIVMLAGYKWMAARGNPAAQERAQSTLIHALIGLAIVVSPFLIVNAFTNLLGTGEGGIARVDTFVALDASQLEAPTVVEVRQETSTCPASGECEYEVDFSEPVICEGNLHLRATNVTSEASQDCDGDEVRTLTFVFMSDSENPRPTGFIERFAMSGSTSVKDVDNNNAILAFGRINVE